MIIVRPAANSHQVPAGMPNTPFSQATRPMAMAVAPIEARSGHGLGLTRW